MSLYSDQLPLCSRFSLIVLYTVDKLEVDRSIIRIVSLALLALAVGRQTAGRVKPVGWTMREADFAVLLHLVERLSVEQRTALGRALAAASGESEAVRLLEEAFARRAALPALRRDGPAAVGLCQRPAPLPLHGLPQDLQCPDRHLPGAAAQEGVLAALRRGARGRHDAGAGGGALRRAPDDQLPLAAPLPRGAGGGAGGARRRGRGGRDLLSPLAQGVPTMAPSRTTRSSDVPTDGASAPASAGSRRSRSRP